MNNLIEKIATLFNGLSVEQIEIYLLWFTFFLIILGGITQVISEGYNEDPPILLTLIQGILMMLIVFCIGLFVCMVYVSLVSSLSCIFS